MVLIRFPPGNSLSFFLNVINLVKSSQITIVTIFFLLKTLFYEADKHSVDMRTCSFSALRITLKDLKQKVKKKKKRGF